MLYGRYQFTCRMETGAILPAYKGSTLRGVFGHALKRVVCALRRQECKTCILKKRCIYPIVFETPLAVDMPEGSRVSHPPHPFVIEPPDTEQMEYRPGETLTCRLVLFGEVNNNLPYFVYAFQQMGRIGIGKRVNGKRGRFVLEEVRNGRKVLYSEKDGKLDLAGDPEDLTLVDPDAVNAPRTVAGGRKETLSAVAPAAVDGNGMKIRVALQTPLRVKFENEIKADLPFHVLARAMLRRMSSLCNTWGHGEPDLDYRGLIRRAGHVRVIENRLRWFDWRRYSNRQERRMFMGGMLGSIVYAGNLGEFLPLLDFCEKVHLGKNTSFGLGKIRVRDAG